MKKITFIISFIILFNFLFANNNETGISFRFEKDLNETQKEFVFTILNVTSDNQVTTIINEIEALIEVTECKIFYKRRCKIIALNSLNPQQIRNIITKFNVDFDFRYFKITDEILLNNLAKFKKKYPITDYIPKPVPLKDRKFPTDYPKYINTDMPEKDKKNYKDRITEWIENNPELYKQITGVEYLDYSSETAKFKIK